MGIFSKFERKVEDSVEGAASAFEKSALTPVQITKKAEKQMKREKVVGKGRQIAPTLYTCLVSSEDDAKLFGYYPTLAGEVETYLAAKADDNGLSLDCKPLVRFVADPELRKGKFDVIAELVAPQTVEELRAQENERYGIATPATVSPSAKRTVSPGSVQGDYQQIPVSQQRENPRLAQSAKKQVDAVATVPSVAPAPVVPSNVVTPKVPEVGQQSPAARAQAMTEQSRIPSVDVSSAKAQPNASAVYNVQANVQPAIPSVDAPIADVQPDIPSVDMQLKPAVPSFDDRFSGLDVMNDDVFVQPQPKQVAPVQNSQIAQVSQQMAANPQQDVSQERTVAVAPQAVHVQTNVYFYDEENDIAYSLTGGVERIGRESSNDIVISDINASRTHAEIHMEPNGTWIISDLGSTNGLYVNGRRVKSAPLNDADIVLIGTTRLEFQIL